MKTWILVPIVAVMLSACAKKEEPATPRAASDAPQLAAPEAGAPAAPAVPPAAPATAAATTPAVAAAADVPTAAPIPPTPPAEDRGAERYVVRPGDTLYSIARRHGLNHRDLARWNDVADPRRLRVGQELLLRAPQG